MTEIYAIEMENISKTETENIFGSVLPELMEQKARNSESSSTDNSLEDSPKIPSDNYFLSRFFNCYYYYLTIG